MRRDDEAGHAPLQSRDVVEGPHLVGAGLEIDQQHVPPLDRPLDPRDEREPRSAA